jgi:hypothetical protein
MGLVHTTKYNFRPYPTLEQELMILSWCFIWHFTLTLWSSDDIQIEYFFYLIYCHLIHLWYRFVWLSIVGCLMSSGKDTAQSLFGLRKSYHLKQLTGFEPCQWWYVVVRFEPCQWWYVVVRFEACQWSDSGDKPH